MLFDNVCTFQRSHAPGTSTRRKKNSTYSRLGFVSQKTSSPAALGTPADPKIHEPSYTSSRFFGCFQTCFPWPWRRPLCHCPLYTEDPSASDLVCIPAPWKRPASHPTYVTSPDPWKFGADFQKPEVDIFPGLADVKFIFFQERPIPFPRTRRSRGQGHERKQRKPRPLGV